MMEEENKVQKEALKQYRETLEEFRTGKFMYGVYVYKRNLHLWICGYL